MNAHMTEWLAAYLDGELNAERQQQVEAHLAQCTDCRAALQQQRQLSALLQAWPAAELRSPGTFSAHVKLRLPRSAPPPTPWQQSLKTLWQWAPLILVSLWAGGQGLGLAANLLLFELWPEAWLALHSLLNPLGVYARVISEASQVLLVPGSQGEQIEAVLMAFSLSLSITLAAGVLFGGWLAGSWAYRNHQSQQNGLAS